MMPEARSKQQVERLVALRGRAALLAETAQYEQTRKLAAIVCELLELLDELLTERGHTALELE
jgi:hypothetical protein